MNIAAILLAAGGSTRLGSPKQLLAFRGRSLLRHAAETALAVPCAPVVVVLGSRAQTLRTELAGLAVTVVENPGWEQGMGGSVRLGLEALAGLERTGDLPPADGVLLTLCDQPLIDTAALRRIVAIFAQAKRADAIAAAAYHDTVGVPALFGRAYFDELRALPEDAGAKRLLRKYAAQILDVPLPQAATDIDTREQYEQLTAHSQIVVKIRGAQR